MTERVFAQPFAGVRDREIYPTEFAPGDVCPPELIAAAESLDVLEHVEPKPVEPDKGEKDKGRARRDEGAKTMEPAATADTAG